jgi:hypothetical protein
VTESQFAASQFAASRGSEYAVSDVFNVRQYLQPYPVPFQFELILTSVYFFNTAFNLQATSLVLAVGLLLTRLMV